MVPECFGLTIKPIILWGTKIYKSLYDCKKNIFKAFSF